MRILVFALFLALCSRPERVPAPDQRAEDSAMMPSAYLVDVSEVDEPDDEIEVTPDDYANWAALWTAQPNRTDYILDGDFTSWGDMTSLPGDGTANRKRVIRYTDADTPPWRRIGTEARISRFAISGYDYWIFHGLTTRGHSSENTIDGSTNIVVNECLIEDGTAAYGIRIRLGSSDNSVQRTVIRNAQGSLRGDAIGVQIRVNAPDATLGNQVVDCEIYNYGDSVQITAAANPDELLGVDGTIIDNNDFYTTYDYHVVGGYGITENAIDIKAGSANASDPWIVSNNRMFGYRRSDPSGGASGSDGTALVVQNFSRNGTVEDNVIFDCTGGIREEVWASAPQVSRDVDYNRNVIHGCQAFVSGTDAGAALNVRLTETFEDNAIVDCVTLAATDVASGQSPHTMNRNVLVNTPQGEYSEGWTPGTGNVEFVTGQVGYLPVVIKRLTGPETVFLANAGVFVTTMTTREAIRDSMITIIRGLTPTRLSTDFFNPERGEIDFTLWTEQHPAACFRRFSCGFDAALPQPPIAHTDVEFIEDDRITVRIAYPKHWGKYGENNIRDMKDLIDEDLYKIDGQSGIGINNQQSTFAAVRLAHTVENDPESPVVYSVIEYSVSYYRSTVA